jgi:hypothetical protein
LFHDTVSVLRSAKVEFEVLSGTTAEQARILVGAPSVERIRDDSEGRAKWHPSPSILGDCSSVAEWADR